ncbi:hypothetical protein HKX48_007514, partial [Thoreauomyces humboldtii]
RAQVLRKSPTKTAPYVEYNGRCVSDTTLIVAWLEERGISKGLDGNLTGEEMATSEAFRYLIEEGIYWHAPTKAGPVLTRAERGTPLSVRVADRSLHAFLLPARSADLP